MLQDCFDLIWIYSNYIAAKAELRDNYKDFRMNGTSIYIKKDIKNYIYHIPHDLFNLLHIAKINEFLVLSVLIKGILKMFSFLKEWPELCL